MKAPRHPQELDHSLQLAVVGNCSYAALIDQHARVVFACLPRFDSDPMFSDLLSGGLASHGFWDILLEDFSHAQQRYVRNTAILSTKLFTSGGDALEIIDFAPRFVHFNRSFHPTQLIRIVRPVAGRPRIVVRCRPSASYGASKCEFVRGSNHIKYFGSEFIGRITTDAPISFIVEEIPFVVMEEFSLVFGPDESLSQAPSNIAHEFLEKTKQYWHNFTQMLKIPFEWQSDVIRSAITLKLCSFEESGAILAALTTSIPEAPNSGRNWDYRFCWLRDSFHTVRALNYLGATKTMEDYLRFIVNIVAGAKHGDLQPLYGLLMQTELPERIVTSLPGYRRMGPVRAGNEAYVQLQNDNYGSVILAVCQMFFDERIENPASDELFHQLEHLGHLAFKYHNQPDAGLWELRGSKRVHTFSSIMCWAGCDRLAKIAKKLNHLDREKFWADAAVEIKQFIMERAWDPEQNSLIAVCSGETKELDAALLLVGELGFLAPDDPKFIGTVEVSVFVSSSCLNMSKRIGKILKKGDFLYRYVEKDDFGLPENAFTICTFWYVNALAYIGRKAEARELFEKLLSKRNHVGLFSEDLDVHTGELWGNFPQTYSMVGLINSAIWLSKSWTDAGLC